MRDSDLLVAKSERMYQHHLDKVYVEKHIGEFPDYILVASPRSKKFHWIELCGEKIKNPVFVDNKTLTDSKGKKYQVCEKCAGILAKQIHRRKIRTGEIGVIV